MDKFEKASQILKELETDGWLIICNEDSDINSSFMLGVESHAKHYIYVAAKGQHEVMAVTMEAPMIKRTLESKGINAKVQSYNSFGDLETFLIRILKNSKIALNFGENVLDAEGTSYADYLRVGDYTSIKNLGPKTKFISAAPIIYKLRSVKSTGELKDLRNTCKATMELLDDLPNWVKVGMTENEIRAKLEYEYMKIGKIAFPSIVATGPNSADPHHNTSKKKIEPGVLLIDTGLKIDEMCSDITWTYWMGKPTEEFEKAYHALYNSKIAANDYMIDGSPNYLPGVKCRESLAKGGYDHEKLFFHGLGHSLGFEAHDVGERMSWKVPKHFKLKENMVYTNEPGLYWENKWGIRLEDDVIIGKEKCELVTQVPKEPLII
jgi:Xaa-Pro aminopeptidase